MFELNLSNPVHRTVAEGREGTNILRGIRQLLTQRSQEIDSLENLMQKLAKASEPVPAAYAHQQRQADIARQIARTDGHRVAILQNSIEQARTRIAAIDMQRNELEKRLQQLCGA